MYATKTKIIKVDIKNGMSPVKIDRGTPVFMARDMPLVPSKLGACGFVIGVTDGKAIIYSLGQNSASRDLIAALDTITDDQIVAYNSHALYLLDRECGDVLI